jgi:hypothetical protein
MSSFADIKKIQIEKVFVTKGLIENVGIIKVPNAVASVSVFSNF